ncbi:aldehyde ferredoxin oxidoreductase N-terminal domain-containing protein [Streptosporangium lutulentum]
MLFAVDLTRGTVEREDGSAEADHFGGSVLGLRLLAERTPAGLDPYDPRALVYIAAACWEACGDRGWPSRCSWPSRR